MKTCIACGIKFEKSGEWTGSVCPDCLTKFEMPNTPFNKCVEEIMDVMAFMLGNLDEMLGKDLSADEKRKKSLDTTLETRAKVCSILQKFLEDQYA